MIDTKFTRRTARCGLLGLIISGLGTREMFLILRMLRTSAVHTLVLPAGQPHDVQHEVLRREIDLFEVSAASFGSLHDNNIHCTPHTDELEEDDYVNAPKKHRDLLNVSSRRSYVG